MDALYNMLTRRSIRKYKPDMVPEEILEKLLKSEHTQQQAGACSRRL